MNRELDNLITKMADKIAQDFLHAVEMYFGNILEAERTGGGTRLMRIIMSTDNWPI